MTDTPSTSGDIKLRAYKLMERYPTELAKAIHVKDKIGFTLTPGDLPKLRKAREDGNPMLAPRVKPLHIGVVTLSKPKKQHKAAFKGEDLEYVIDAKGAVWSLLNEDGKNATLYDALLSIEVTEKKDGSLVYGMFKAGAGYHDQTVEKFGVWQDDIIDPRLVAKLAPPTPEELSKAQATNNLANRPDALVVTSSTED